MSFKINNRQFLSALILFFYLAPLLFLVYYSIGLMSPDKRWSILSIGLLIISFGALALTYLLYYWEEVLKEKLKKSEKQLVLLEDGQVQTLYHPLKETKVTSLDPLLLIKSDEIASSSSFKEDVYFSQTALADYKEKDIPSLEEFKKKSQEISLLKEENQQLTLKTDRATQDFADYKTFSEEQLKQKTLQISTFQQTVEEQRTEIENQQEQIRLLTTKVNDLTYEIKTLLYLQESESLAKPIYQPPQTTKPPSPPVVPQSPEKTTLSEMETLIKTTAEAEILLKRCLGVAQTFIGTNYYGNESSRYREFSSPYYTIDQRRLFDSLRSETSALILVYSLKEEKFVFANHLSKTILGWNPEKLIQDFSGLCQESMVDWKKALALLTTQPQAQTRLLLKTRDGDELVLNFHLGQVSVGLFKNYAIGIMYPDQ